MTTKKRELLTTAQELFDKACDNWYAQEYDTAFQEFTECLKIREEHLGKYHEKTARTYYSMGCALHGQGSYEQALIALRRTQRIATVTKDRARQQAATEYISWVLKSKGGKTDEMVADYQAILKDSITKEIQGDAQMSQGNHEQAVQSYQASLQIESEASGDSHVDVADLYVKIANSLCATPQIPNDDDNNDDDDDKSMEYFHKAHDIYKGSFGEDHPYTLAVDEKVLRSNDGESGPTAVVGGRPSRTMLVKQLSFRGKGSGGGSGRNLMGNSSLLSPSGKGKSKLTMAAMGISPHDLLEYDRNISLVDRNRRCFLRSGSAPETVGTGPLHHGVHEEMNAQSQCFWMALGIQKSPREGKDDDKEALVALRRAFRQRDFIYGRDHGLAMVVLDRIREVLSGEDPGSLPSREQGEELDRDSSDRKNYLQDLYKSIDKERSGDNWMIKGDGIKALREYESARVLEETALGKYHLEYARLNLKCANLLLEQGQAEDAKSKYKSAFLIYRTSYGKGHATTKNALERLQASIRSEQQAPVWESRP